MKYYVLFMCAGMGLLLNACKSKSAPAPMPDAGKSYQSGTTQPEMVLYVTTVDNLLLREQPNRQAKVMAKFREGEFLIGTGEVSANKEEVVLREIPHNEPYYKVSGALEQQSGWAYGGGLLCVYAGTKAGSPQLSNLSQLSNFLKSLNTKKLDSGKRAWTFVQNNFGSAQGAGADAAFILLESFLRRMETEGEYYSQTETHPWTDEDYKAIYEDKFDMAKYPLTKQFADNGFRLETAEGMVYPVVDWLKLQSFFSSKSTPAMKMFIDQRVIEQIDQEYDDGGLIIPLEQVADRAVFWEKFNDENPFFPLKDETIASEEYGRQTLVTGTDNTPTFDYETKAIDAEFRKMWDYVLGKYPGTETAKLVQQMRDLCAAEGWKHSEKVQAFTDKVLGIERSPGGEIQ